MKGNIRRLAVLVIIAAIAMFTVAATASADGHHWKKTIEGEYAFTGVGSCLIAIQGFNTSLQPIGGPTGPWLESSVTYEGVATFNKDGTGSVTAVLHGLDTLYSQALGAPPDAGSANLSHGFTYTVAADSGKITLTYVKGTYELDWTAGPNVPPSPNSPMYLNMPQPYDGVLSPDEKTYFISLGAPSILYNTSDKANTIPIGVQQICNIVFHGFKIE